ncbi:MAG: hypothetical protein KF754_01830 [Planctomycetes bacterium]|nr:hypothetical protein [Planctomycetota bacterium]
MRNAAWLAVLVLLITACESTPARRTEDPQPDPKPRPEPKPDPKPQPPKPPAHPRLDKSKPPESPAKPPERPKLAADAPKPATFSQFMDGPVATWRAGISPPYFAGRPHAMQNTKENPSWFNGKSKLKMETRTLANGGWEAHGYGEAFYLSNGKIFAKGTFNAGKMHGPWIFYTESGALEKVTCYVNNEANGPFGRFEDEKMTQTGRYQNGKATGTWWAYHPDGWVKFRDEYEMVGGKSRTVSSMSYQKDGQCTRRTSYVNGVAQPLQDVWVADPALVDEDYFKDQKLIPNAATVGRYELQYRNADSKSQGWQTLYDKAGNRYVDTWYEAGVQTGPFVRYNPKGAVTEKGEFLEGERHGLCRGYGGFTNWESTYVKGKLHGPARQFNADGTQVLLEGRYEDDKPTGEWTRHVRKGSFDLVERPEAEYWIGKGKLNASLQFEGTWVYTREDGSKALEKTVIGTGPYRGYHKNGKLRSEGTTTNGRFVGVWKTWYEDGTPQEIGLYDSLGEAEGSWSSFHPSGKLASRGDYLEGDAVGAHKFYDDTGHLTKINLYGKLGGLQESTTKEGPLAEPVPAGTVIDPEKRTGVWTVSRMVGKELQLTFRAELLNDVQHGLTTEYYPGKNQKRVEGRLVANLREGPWKQWYETGVLAEEGTFVAGKIEGAFLKYHPNGKKAEEQQVVAGVPNGAASAWYADGSLRLEGEFTNGKKTGTWKEYGPGAVLRKLETLNAQSKLDGPYQMFDEAGKPLQDGSYKDGVVDGAWKVYYAGGKLKEAGEYAAGGRVGLWKFYYINGQVSEESNFLSGRRIGLSQSWHDNGQLKQECSYNESGKIDGAFKSYFENGKPMKEGQYKAGKPVGRHVDYHRNGNTAREEEFDDEGQPKAKAKRWKEDGTEVTE